MVEAVVILSLVLFASILFNIWCYSYITNLLKSRNGYMELYKNCKIALVSNTTNLLGFLSDLTYPTTGLAFSIRHSRNSCRQKTISSMNDMLPDDLVYTRDCQIYDNNQAIGTRGVGIVGSFKCLDEDYIDVWIETDQWRVGYMVPPSECLLLPTNR